MGMESIAVKEGDLHARLRQMISPAFHYNQLRAMSSIMAQETIAAIDATIPPDSAPTTIDLLSWFTSLTLSIICSSSFGDSLEQIPHAKETIRYSLSTVLRLLAKRINLLVTFIPVIRSLPILGQREVDEGLANYHAVVLRMVQDRKAGRCKSKCEGDDLLDLLIKARDPKTGDGLSDVQIEAQAASFLFAGHETTSTLMTWLLRDLLTRPKLWQQLRDEVQRVTNGEMVTAAHVPQLVLIDACVHESFRMHPPSNQTFHEAAVDHWLQPQAETTGSEVKPAIFVPKGTLVIHDVYGMQRSTDVWGENAEVYDEQRWVKGSERYSKPTHPAAFTGLSLGNYSCIGANFAFMEAKTMLAEIVRRVDMEVVPGQSEVITKRLTIVPEYGLKAIVRRVPPSKPSAEVK